jgi:hypothetical protein
MNTRKIILVLALTSMLALCVSPLVVRFVHRNDWKKDTTPLPVQTISDLCQRFDLSHEDLVCNGSKKVYAADFGEVLRARFSLKNPIRTEKADATFTYQDVEKVIGAYKLECENLVELPASGYSYFRCLYDFRGDRYWREALYFYYPEQTLFSIRTGVGEGD